ncbi:UDP-N-acetyl glucosamine 2-epimerase [Shewanella baltica]|uniref:UDP-N-acetylglucosamine 2-epimerase n=1 Tax=Shewanella baltica TaxID=62322 RepID=UPI0007B4B386|nr:UDP-N-acetylglucosamine 2-epimerase [Shewanella baltica]KZK65102.1 UDP-N-acetyl glucosamine 2-epimerase [Shewanella baltica]
MSRKICVVSATRAEYGLLKPLLTAIHYDVDLILQLVVTGTHLSPEFGYTLKEIQKDPYPIAKKIEILLSSDSAVGVSKSMGLAQISFAEAFDDLRPDLVLVLGDRYELLPIVLAANIAHIPVAHLSGGELTEGVMDELFRHAITKLAHLHFAAIEDYRQRIIQMGEHPSRVFTVGEAGLDNIREMTLMNKAEIEESLQCPLKSKNLIITYHPDSHDNLEAIKQSFRTILAALDTLEDTLLIFTKANSDIGGRLINELIDEYVSLNPRKSLGFTSLGQRRYLSLLQYVDAVVGNSSSGIVETPSFKLPSINIGPRQQGRIRANSTIDVECETQALTTALSTIYNEAFLATVKQTQNPYDQGGSSLKIKEIIKQFDLSNLEMKRFYDLPKH